MKKINTFIITITIIINIINFILLKNKELTDIALFITLNIVLFIPLFLRKKTKIKLPSNLELLYLIFIFIAFLLGSNLKFYSKIFWYDTVVHSISGTLTSLLGLYTLLYFNKYNKKDTLFNIIYIFIFALAIAGLWEILEFLIDLVFKADAQKVIETGVFDTMKDIISAIVGYGIFMILYQYKFKNKIKG